MMLEAQKFFYKLYAVDDRGAPVAFLGCAFAVAPNGGLLTCRHVVDAALLRGQRVAVMELDQDNLVLPDTEILYPDNSDLDIAFIPNALKRTKSEFFPLLTPEEVTLGQRIYTYGFFSIGEVQTEMEVGYFGGVTVSVKATSSDGPYSLTLPFPVLEGMSGSPILTFCNGTKLVGLAYGNRSSRICKSEVHEYLGPEGEIKESINRIVEFGLAYHGETIIRALRDMKVDGFIVTTDVVDMPGLPR